MTQYNPVTDEIMKALKHIVGERFASNNPDKLVAYKTDQEENVIFHHMPEAVVYPETTEQVAEIMKLANEKCIPVTPRSGGTGLAGHRHT